MIYIFRLHTQEIVESMHSVEYINTLHLNTFFPWGLELSILWRLALTSQTYKCTCICMWNWICFSEPAYLLQIGPLIPSSKYFTLLCYTIILSLSTITNPDFYALFKHQHPLFPNYSQKMTGSLTLKEGQGGGRGGGATSMRRWNRLIFQTSTCKSTSTPILPPCPLSLLQQKVALQVPKGLPFSMLYILFPSHFLRNRKHHLCFSSLFLSLDYSDSPSQWFPPQGIILKSLPLTTQINWVDI